MKKSLIALAVLAASGAAMAQSSVTLFGIVDTGVGYVKNSGGDSTYGLANSGLATSRLGFRGVEDLGRHDRLKRTFLLDPHVRRVLHTEFLELEGNSVVDVVANVLFVGQHLAHGGTGPVAFKVRVDAFFIETNCNF